ncbi:MAG TPA: sigma factor-like helix-turn-helix DNA-binding protein, partial [Candidatus Obscuribacterales bacterium]
DSMMRQDIYAILGEVLNERERDIIALRYGLQTGESHTLEEVGGLFNLSRERVRQIQTKAMRKLRRPQVAARLRGWLR